MRPLFAAVLASASLAAAQSTSVEEFWWSYPPMPAENVTDPETKIYIAEFEVCGNGTCESCEPKAKSCLSQQYTNICYEPSSGETCCEDVLGTSCVAGFYCAYAGNNAAFCCKDGVSVDECSNIFNEALSEVQIQGPTTVVVTQIKTPEPTETGQGQAKHSGEPDSQSKKDGLSLGAKIGIALGAVAIVGLIAGAIAFFILRKRRNAKYVAAQGAGEFSKPAPGHYEPPNGVATGQYVPGSPAPPAYSSPMAQNGQPGTPGAEQSEYYKAPLQPAGAGSPYQKSPETFRHDGVEVAEMPAPEPQVYEMGPSEHKP